MEDIGDFVAFKQLVTCLYNIQFGQQHDSFKVKYCTVPSISFFFLQINENKTGLLKYTRVTFTGQSMVNMKCHHNGVNSQYNTGFSGPIKHTIELECDGTEIKCQFVPYIS